MTSDDHDAQWRCQICGRWWVVPDLARDCEAKHRAEADQ